MDTGPLTLNGYYMQIFLRIYYLFGAIKTIPPHAAYLHH